MQQTPSAISSAIVVFVQVHYTDVWGDICKILEDRLFIPYRLVVTTSHVSSAIERPQSPHLVGFDILHMENRGRDILPFLKSLNQTHDFEIGLKLHTKKSPQRADGANWLAALLNTLLPTASTPQIVKAIHADPRIGLVAPPGFCLPVGPWVLDNASSMARVMDTMGCPLTDMYMEDAYFAAGSMFWFRRDALSRLSDPALVHLFEPEEGQLDGTTAHGIERLFGVETRRQGYLTVALPSLMASHPNMPATEIMQATRCHSEKPNRFFPAPYVVPESAKFPVYPSSKGLVIRVLAPFYLALPAPVRRWLKAILKPGQSHV